MSQDIRVGSRVKLLNEKGEGTVVSLTSSEAVVKIDGFNLVFSLRDLVCVEAEIHHELENIEIDPETLKIEQRMARKLVNLKKSKQATYELDLHIEELLDRFEHLSSAEILRHQLQCCREFIIESMDKRFDRVIIIHGVGAGVLKNEIHRWLHTLNGVEYCDAPYRIYGYGATEVIIHY